MGRHTWHSRVKNAIMELGSEYGYEPNSGIVYYKIGRNRFEYHPDVFGSTKPVIGLNRVFLSGKLSLDGST